MDNNEKNNRSAFRYRGSLVGPAIIITIGVVFLLNNLGYLSGGIWDTILNLWPVMLIAIGLDSVLQRRGVAGPALFIGLGIIFLLSNFDLISWDVWDLILKLWPLLLIAIGLDILIGRRSIWGAILALIIILATLAGSLWYFGPGPGSVTADAISILQPLRGVSEAEIVLRPSVGGVQLKPFTSSENLIDGDIHQWRGESIQERYEVFNDLGEYSLQSVGVSFIYPASLSSGSGWLLYINDGLPITIDLSLGVGKIEADFRELIIDEFKINNGVGATKIFLPQDGVVSGDIDSAIGDVLIIVPAETALKLRADTALSNIQAPQDYIKDGRTYTSPDYEMADNRVDLFLNQAIGIVRIRSDGSSR